MTVNTVIKTILIIIALFSLTALSINAAVLDVTGDVNYSEAWEILDIVNQYRTDAGLNPVTMDSVLMDAAMIRAAECSVYYSHNRPNGTECFSLIEVRGYAAENAAVDFLTAKEAVAGWMDSEGHRANIMSDKFLSMGVGVFTASDGFRYWTQFFDSGTPRAATKSNDVKSVTYSIEVNDVLVRLNTIQNNTIAFHGEKPFSDELVKISGIYSYVGNMQIFVDNSKLSYVSSNPGVAAVDDNGVVRPVSAGNTVISVFLISEPNNTVTYNVNVTEHIYTKWTIQKQANCVNPGRMSAYCTICGVTVTETIPATEKHDYSILTILQYPSCYANGMRQHQCSVCGTEYISEIPATGRHVYDDGVVTIEPTTIKSGVKTYTCTTNGCNARYTELIPALKFDTPLEKTLDAVTEKQENIPDVVEITTKNQELTEIKLTDPPLAMIPDTNSIENTLNGKEDTDIKISIKILPFIILLVLLENMVLIMIVKKYNR